MVQGFQAIVLICLAGTPTQDCAEANAVVYQSIHVDNELGCSTGWEEIIARGGLKESLAGGNYIKTLCRRGKTDE